MTGPDRVPDHDDPSHLIGPTGRPKKYHLSGLDIYLARPLFTNEFLAIFCPRLVDDAFHPHISILREPGQDSGPAYDKHHSF